MSPRRFYKQTFTITVYSEDVPLEYDDLDDIYTAINTGDSVGSEITDTAEAITGKQAADALYSVGSEPGFFQLDVNGNDIEVST